MLEGLRGFQLCRREGIAQNLYYRWSKDFLDAGKKRLAGDTAGPPPRRERLTIVPRRSNCEAGRPRL